MFSEATTTTKSFTNSTGKHLCWSLFIFLKWWNYIKTFVLHGRSSFSECKSREWHNSLGNSFFYLHLRRTKMFCLLSKFIFTNQHYLDIAQTFINFNSFANSSKTIFAIIWHHRNLHCRNHCFRVVDFSNVRF